MEEVEDLERPRVVERNEAIAPRGKLLLTRARLLGDLVAVEVLAHRVVGVTGHVAARLEKGGRLRVVLGVDAREEVARRVRPQRDVGRAAADELVLYAGEQLAGDAAPARLRGDEQHVHPAALGLEAALQVGELALGPEGEAHDAVALERDPGQLRVEVVVKERLHPELLDVDRVEGAAAVPQVDDLALPLLVVVSVLHWSPFQSWHVNMLAFQ